MHSISNSLSLIPREAQVLIQDHALKDPNNAILAVEPTLRDLSPLFLNEPPYHSDDSFLDKCLKSIQAVIGLIHYARSDVRALIEYRPVATHIHSLVQPKLDEISEEMCNMYLSSLDSRFALEYYSAKLEVLKENKTEIPKDELMKVFLNSFHDVLKARQSAYIDGKKLSTQDKTTRATLLDERKTHLSELYNQLEKVSGTTIEDAERGVQVFKELFELQFELNIGLNRVLVDIMDTLEYPL